MTVRPLRIAMTSYYLPSESKIGVGFQVDALASELARRGHHVTVFSACRPVESAAYEHRLIALSGRNRTFRFAMELRKLDLRDFDVLHAHGDDYWMWRRRVGVHVRTLHGSCFEEARHIRGMKERLRMVLLGFSEVLASVVADRTAVISPATRRWTPWVRTVIPNGVDTRRFAPSPIDRATTPVVLFVGTWSGRKRGALVAEAFLRDVAPAMPDAQLWMVTRDAPDGLPSSIKVLGAVTDEELPRLYRQAWVFTLPSEYEGFGIPYAEAMASGLAVVATPNLGARYVTDEGRAGVLCDEHTLGQTLHKVLADSRLRSRLEAAGLERSRDFALVAVAQAYEDLYA